MGTPLNIAPGQPIVLNEHWRVVFDPLQWILQRRQGTRWRDRSFCCSKAALLRCIREHCGEVDIREVLKLPDWHPDRSAATAAKASTLIEIPDDPVSALLPALKSVEAA